MVQLSAIGRQGGGLLEKLGGLIVVGPHEIALPQELKCCSVRIFNGRKELDRLVVLGPLVKLAGRVAEGNLSRKSNGGDENTDGPTHKNPV
jgi:hypothetical protein